MSQDIADWAVHAGATSARRCESDSHALTSSHSEAWDRLLRQPQYRHFSRIPARILRCLNHFDVTGDLPAAATILGAYYLFIGVVDNSIDSGTAKTAEIVFEVLEAKTTDERFGSEIALVTIRLREHIAEHIKPEAIDRLRRLYAVVMDERSADSIEQYLERRTAVGCETADLSYLLIRPFLSNDEPRLRSFMQRVGAVGCLLDTVFDWRADWRHGLLGFEPTFRDYLSLVRATAFTGLTLALEHPRLWWLFTQSTLDIVRDRLVRSTPFQVVK